MSETKRNVAKRRLQTKLSRGRKRAGTRTPVSRPTTGGTTSPAKACGQPEAEVQEDLQPGLAVDASLEARIKGDARGGGDKAKSRAGTESLEKAAAEAVRQNWEDLSRALVEKAKAGNVDSFKMLLTLADRRKPREKPVKKPRYVSQALRLAAEPQWEDWMDGKGGNPGDKEQKPKTHPEWKDPDVHGA
jgi:hypothetical protein